MDTYQIKGLVTVFVLLFMMIFSSSNFASIVTPNSKGTQPKPTETSNTTAGCMACHQGEPIKISKK